MFYPSHPRSSVSRLFDQRVLSHEAGEVLGSGVDAEERKTGIVSRWGGLTGVRERSVKLLESERYVLKSSCSGGLFVVRMRTLVREASGQWNTASLQRHLDSHYAGSLLSPICIQFAHSI